jgi:uncharacterized membrane protein YeaQ/YmgE (transglycosylase-associated protein family)
MNPSYRIILWLVISALAGWIGSRFLINNPRKGSLAYVLIGVAGAVLGVVVGGIVTHALFAADTRNNDLTTTLVIALLGVCAMIICGRMIKKATT